MKSASTPACSLTHRLFRLHDEYAAILAEAEQWRAAAGGRQAAELGPALASLGDRIQRQQALLAGVRRDWEADPSSHSPSLQQRISATASQLERLILLIQECERLMRSSREELRPTLDRATRHREMQRAYGDRRS